MNSELDFTFPAHDPRAINGADSEMKHTSHGSPVPDNMHLSPLELKVQSYGVHPTDVHPTVLNHAPMGVKHTEPSGAEHVGGEPEGDQLSTPSQTNNKNNFGPAWGVSGLSLCSRFVSSRSEPSGERALPNRHR